jgi:divinyl chlorophyllide a 8-vinyl-reductase
MNVQPHSLRVFMLGATGTIGRATVAALLARGHEVVCFVRPGTAPLPCRASFRFGDVTNPASLAQDGFCGEAFDAIVSCLASRTGAPLDAWAIDHKAHLDVLAAGHTAGVRQMVLVSAICVQRPKLAFQHAKLAFERALIDSGMIYSIVRPTAYFKSLSGQVNRLKAGKPFLLFGDGALTACKPISDADLAAYVANCLHNADLQNRILPIGGPGPAITPRAQGEALFQLLQMRPKFRRVPVGLLDSIIAVLSGLGHVSPHLKAKAELARIGRYYATESMLVFDPATARYEADATPSTGTDTLFAHYDRLLRGEARDDRGAHAVF